MGTCIHCHSQLFRYLCSSVCFRWSCWVLIQKAVTNVSIFNRSNYFLTLTDTEFFFAGWFGIRKNFSQFLLSTLPCLQEYGNIGYHSTRNQNANSEPANSQAEEPDENKSKDSLKKFDHLKPVMPIVSIDMPD